MHIAVICSAKKMPKVYLLAAGAELKEGELAAVDRHRIKEKKIPDRSNKKKGALFSAEEWDVNMWEPGRINSA